MRKNYLLTTEEQSATERRHSFYFHQKTKGALRAEIIGVAKLRDSLEGTLKTIITASSSSAEPTSGSTIGIAGTYELGDALVKGSHYYAAGTTPSVEYVEMTQKWKNWMSDDWVTLSSHEINPYFVSAVEHTLYKTEKSAAELISSLKTKLDREIHPFFITSDITISDFTPLIRETSVTELVAYIQANSRLPFAGKLVSRLEALREISEEEFPEQEPISPYSLRDFITFIESLNDVKYPSVVLTYEGNIRSEWTVARNKHLALEFTGDNDVRFVVFSPDSSEPYKTNRVAGVSTINSIYEQVAPYGVFNWVIEKKTVKQHESHRGAR